MESQRLYASLHGLTRGSLGFFWLYQGFLPKIVRPSSELIEALALAGVEARTALDVLYGIGLVEIVLGLTLLSAPRWRWPLWVNLLLAATYMVGSVIVAPKYLASAYSPAAVGLLLITLSVVGLRTSTRQLKLDPKNSGASPAS